MVIPGCHPRLSRDDEDDAMTTRDVTLVRLDATNRINLIDGSRVGAGTSQGWQYNKHRTVQHIVAHYCKSGSRSGRTASSKVGMGESRSKTRQVSFFFSVCLCELQWCLAGGWAPHENMFCLAAWVFPPSCSSVRHEKEHQGPGVEGSNGLPAVNM